MGVVYSNSVNHEQQQVSSYSTYSLGLNLQLPDDFTQKYFSIKSLYPQCYMSCWTIQSEFLELISLMSSSTYEILCCEYNNGDEDNSEYSK